MAFRRFLRGQVEWPRLESVVREVMARYDLTEVRVEFLEVDNWLSVPFVVNDHYFVKVITDQHARVHSLLTAGRNLGAFSRGTEGFFEHVDGPVEMAVLELRAIRQMRGRGVNVPDPVEAFEHDGMGVLVVEYLPAFESIDVVSEPERFLDDILRSLRVVHDAGLGHGDLHAENVLVADDEVYFIDATSIREDAASDARAYDIACVLGVLEPLVGAKRAVTAAAEWYPTTDLLAARQFLDFVNIRPDHDFDAASLRGAIETVAR